MSVAYGWSMWDAGVKEYAREAADASPLVIELLPYLRGRLDLQPVPDLSAHLAALQERYLGLLKLRHQQWRSRPGGRSAAHPCATCRAPWL